MTISMTRFRNLSHVFNVENYGSLTTDIYEPLASALHAARQYGSKAIVYLPGGNYNIRATAPDYAAHASTPNPPSNPLTIWSGVTFMGDGKNVTNIKYITTHWNKAWASSLMFRFGSRVTFDGITFDGNRDTIDRNVVRLQRGNLVFSTKGANFITVNNCSFVRQFAQMGVQNTDPTKYGYVTDTVIPANEQYVETIEGFGLMLDGGSDHTITNSDFDDNDGTGLHIASGWHQTDRRANNVLVKNCSASRNKWQGVGGWGAGVNILYEDVKLEANGRHGGINEWCEEVIWRRVDFKNNKKAATDAHGNCGTIVYDNCSFVSDPTQTEHDQLIRVVGQGHGGNYGDVIDVTTGERGMKIVGEPEHVIVINPTITLHSGQDWINYTPSTTDRFDDNSIAFETPSYPRSITLQYPNAEATYAQMGYKTGANVRVIPPNMKYPTVNPTTPNIAPHLDSWVLGAGITRSAANLPSGATVDARIFNNGATANINFYTMLLPTTNAKHLGPYIIKIRYMQMGIGDHWFSLRSGNTSRYASYHNLRPGAWGLNQWQEEHFIGALNATDEPRFTILFRTANTPICIDTVTIQTLT